MPEVGFWPCLLRLWGNNFQTVVPDDHNHKQTFSQCEKGEKKGAGK